MAKVRVLVSAVLLVAALLPASAMAAGPAPAPIRLGYCGGDDWEPTLAQSGKFIAVAITHYVGDPTCDPASGSASAIYVQTSSDAGATWTA